MPVESLPIAVLISGVGSNLQSLIDNGTGSTRIVAVLSDRPRAAGLLKAEAAGIPTAVVDWREFRDRDRFTEVMCEAVDRFGARAIVLAGFMRVLGSLAIKTFPDAIINVHPSLLPSFPGANAVEQALAHGVTHTGVTVHFVDEEVDHGPIIAQQPVPILDDDDVDSLHARIQVVEHRLLPEVVDAFGRGAISVAGRRVQWNSAVLSEGLR
ncbi:MAG: phosphoribosylglycinamide formyltransferase [Acidimicrobiia bacterium]|nr:MAG: phosphoribosylglycinamide formyltransferase [Acidimicrobiia bacterium]